MAWRKRRFYWHYCRVDDERSQAAKRAAASLPLWGVCADLELEYELDVTAFVIDPRAHLVWVYFRQKAR